MTNGDRDSTRGRSALTKQVVVEKAIEIIDAEGIESLSMRVLGKALDVKAMTLYRYVKNRQTLLTYVLDHVVYEMSADPEVLLQPKDEWQDYLRRVAHSVRRIGLMHPKVIPLMVSQPPAAPWVRPPLRSLRWIDSFLSGLRTKGLDDSQAVDVYRSFTGFLIGHLLIEVSSLGVELVPAAESGDQPSDPDLGSYPHLLQLAPLLAHVDYDVEFNTALERHLSGLATEAPGQSETR